MIYDLLEWEGIDYRTTPLHEEQLALLYQSHKKFDLPWELSQVLHFASLEAVAQEKRKSGAKTIRRLDAQKKGLLLSVGRKKGSWWKWKSDPKTIDAVCLCNARTRSPNKPLYRLYFCPLG